MMNIRKYIESDKDAILSLWEDCGLIHPGTDYSRDLDAKMKFQPELFFVAMSNDEIIGSIMVGYDGRRGWLNCLAVRSDYRKRGYGKDLVDYGIDQLKKLGCPKVNLQVRKSNLGVVSFYKKLGFKEDEVISLGKRLE